MRWLVNPCPCTVTACKFGIGFITIEEMFGIEKDTQPLSHQEIDRLAHHGNAFFQCGAQCFGDVEIPTFTYDAHRAGAGANKCRQRWIDIDFSGRAPFSSR